mmetsp:Transcript_7063/g.17518  ORF Transcript_7063/g.17518 Transcript_7063/m.17518 type:complete len:215 (+) Transcript_7063:696-1340(+)
MGPRRGATIFRTMTAAVVRRTCRQRRRRRASWPVGYSSVAFSHLALSRHRLRHRRPDNHRRPSHRTKNPRLRFHHHHRPRSAVAVSPSARRPRRHACEPSTNRNTFPSSRHCPLSSAIAIPGRRRIWSAADPSTVVCDDRGSFHHSPRGRRRDTGRTPAYRSRRSRPSFDRRGQHPVVATPTRRTMAGQRDRNLALRRRSDRPQTRPPRDLPTP